MIVRSTWLVPDQVAVLSSKRKLLWLCISTVLESGYCICLQNHSLQNYWGIYWRDGKILPVLSQDAASIGQGYIDFACPKANAKKLKDTCRTLRVQHIDSYTVFPAVLMDFQAMTSTSHASLGVDWNWDTETVMRATGFLHQLESSSFLICVQILLECLTRMRGLTLKLQMEAVDVLYAYKQVDNVIKSLKNMREKASHTFSVIFEETTQLGKKLHGDDFELEKPRLASRQVHRDNVQVASVEDYYRVTLYNEFLTLFLNWKEDLLLVSLTLLGFSSCCLVSVPPGLMRKPIFHQSLLRQPSSMLMTCHIKWCFQRNTECGCLSGKNLVVPFLSSS